MTKYQLFRPTPEGPYHYRFQVDGKRIQKSTRETSRAKAQAVADEAFEDALLHSRGKERCPTLGELIPLWIESHELTAGPNHIRNVIGFGNHHLYGLKNLLLVDLSTGAVEAARNEYLLTHARTSANQWLTTLTLLVNWAIRRGMLKMRPWSVPSLKIQRKPRVILPMASTLGWIEAFNRLLTKDPGLETVLRLIMGLGLRVSEAVGARWEWLDWECRTYTPGRLLADGQYKTKGGESVALPLVSWLFRYLESIRKPQGLIAPDPKGQPYCDAQVRRLMKRANLEAGTPGLTPHRLRGTYATMLSRAGVPYQDIQRAMRHKSVTTTIEYLEVDLSNIARAQEGIAQITGLAGFKTGASFPRSCANPDSEIFKESSASDSVKLPATEAKTSTLPIPTV